ncbi:hypothetical protein JCM10207_003642 [Rhodosporidiobolus poonsookiae]
MVGRRVWDLLRSSTSSTHLGPEDPAWDDDYLQDQLRVFVKAALEDPSLPVVVQPGLIAPPNLDPAYRAQGFEPVPWGDFKPNVLVFQATEDGRVIMEVIDIRSNTEQSAPRYLDYYKNERFKLSAWHFFLSWRLAAMQSGLAPDTKDDLHRLTMSDHAVIWRYTGCYSEACTQSSCVLNEAGLDVDDLRQGTPILMDDTAEEMLCEELFFAVPGHLGMISNLGQPKEEPESQDVVKMEQEQECQATVKSEEE